MPSHTPIWNSVKKTLKHQEISYGQSVANTKISAGIPAYTYSWFTGYTLIFINLFLTNMTTAENKIVVTFAIINRTGYCF